jgi:hypothetical protein
MDYTEYTSAKKRLGTNPNLCDLFKLLAIETWKRIEYAYIKNRIKVYETTLTQNLIFSINAYNDQYGLNIEIFEANDENANGNDLELIIKYPNEGVEFYAPIQAKKVYKNGRYLSMDHGDQIESLIKYASGTKSEPFYLLYNYTSLPLKPNVTLTSPNELTGCTLISARHLFNNYYKKRIRKKDDGSKEMTWVIPNFYNLNPSPAFAWHEIVCPGNVAELQRLLVTKDIVSNAPESSTALIPLGEFPQGFYPINTFKKDSGWINITDLSITSNYTDEGVLGRIPEYEEINSLKKTEKTERESSSPIFNPKSRVVFSQNQSSKNERQ